MVETQEKPETTLAVVARRMDEITTELTQDDICERIMFLDFVREQVRNAEAAMKANVQAWMESKDVKEFYIGTVKYYLATDKETKCVNVPGALKAILLANGVDPDAAGINVNDIALPLSANAWKQGACKKLLPQDKFEELFVTTEKVALHVEGAKAAKKLQSLDTKFIDQK